MNGILKEAIKLLDELAANEETPVNLAVSIGDAITVIETAMTGEVKASNHFALTPDTLVSSPGWEYTVRIVQVDETEFNEKKYNTVYLSRKDIPKLLELFPYCPEKISDVPF